MQRGAILLSQGDHREVSLILIMGTTEYFNKIQNNGNSENIYFIIRAFDYIF